MDARRRKDSPVVMVALQGNETDSEVIFLACQVARKRGGRLAGVFVVEVPQAQPLGSWSEEQEQRARAVLATAREQGGNAGCAMEVHVLPARDAGHALVDEAAEVAADVVVVGKPFPSRRGDAAMYVLDKAPCAVILRRPEAPALR